MQNMLQYITTFQTAGIFEHFFVIFCILSCVLFVIFCIFFVIFCLFSCIFCILKQTGQGQFLQCRAMPNLKAFWVEALMCFCNPQEAANGSIRAAAVWSSVTGNQCGSSSTSRHCYRAGSGDLLTKHVLLPAIHPCELMKLLQNMHNVRMKNMQNMKYMLNILRLVKYT